MADEEPLLRNVADTARWVAYYRALENERPDALFRDRFARELAGERGKRIAERMNRGRRVMTWPFTARTMLMDRMVLAEVAAGADMVINLAAGLDARPYRMPLPPGLTWVEVDTGELLDEKERALKDAEPSCRVERYRRDLSRAEARHELFSQLGERSKRAVVLSEGLVMYLKPEDVRALAEDLAATPAVRAWILDLYHPRILGANHTGEMGRLLTEANARFQFAPKEGVKFFELAGWRCAELESTLQEAIRMGRMPWIWRMLVRVFERNPKERFTWSAICRFVR